MQDYDSIDAIDRIWAYNEPNEESESTAFHYHKTCYSSFTSAWHISRLKKVGEKVKSSQQESPGPSNEPRRASRRCIPPLDTKLCIFCQTDTGKATCLLMQNRCIEIEIMEAAKKDFVMRSRLANIIDLVAGDAIYHPPMQSRDFSVKLRKTSLMKRQSQKQYASRNSLDEIRLGLARGDVYLLTDVYERYSFLLEVELACRLSRIKIAKKDLS